jgi:hypothetical protein
MCIHAVDLLSGVVGGTTGEQRGAALTLLFQKLSVAYNREAIDQIAGTWVFATHANSGTSSNVHFALLLCLVAWRVFRKFLLSQFQSQPKEVGALCLRAASQRPATDSVLLQIGCHFGFGL